MTRVLLVLLIATVGFAAQAQEQVKTVARPNIPGSFIVDFGLNRTLNEPDDFDYGVFGSRTVNLYYQYPIRFGRSRFSFNPGAGFSLERFKLKNEFMLFDAAETPIATATQIEKYTLVDANTLFPNTQKVMLIGNYFDVPLEFRFDTKPEDISRSFNVAIGGRAGYLIDSMQKIKFKEDGQVKKSKSKEDFGMTQFRYGTYIRIGIGGFNWFGFYNLAPLFNKSKAPNDTVMNTFTFGISINGF